MTNQTSSKTNLSSQAIWYVAPRRVELQTTQLDATCATNHVRIQAIASAISKGTESLVYNGHIPQSEWTRMRAPMQVGDFPFPVKYGYAIVGEVVQGPPSLLGKNVFALHPHESVFDVPEYAAIPLPDNLPPKRAVLCANMETALNAVWDGNPGPGDQISIIGAGIVGSLIASIVGKIPGTNVTLIDRNPKREAVAQVLNVDFSLPDLAKSSQDIIFHASGNPEGLNTAINITGNEAKIIELSWYGDKVSSLNLGGAFHSQRLQIISSQVGQIASARRPRWTHKKRLELAMSLVNYASFDEFLKNCYPFKEITQHLPSIMDPNNDAICPIILY